MAAREQLFFLYDKVPEDRLEVRVPADDVWNYSPDFLDLPFWRTIAVKKSEHDYEVIAELQTLPECPSCQRAAKVSVLKPVGTLVQTVRDEPREIRRVVIHFLRQRFKCSCGQELLQPRAGVVGRRSMTVRGALFTALECFDRSFEKVGEEVGVSGKKVKEIFADLISILDKKRMVVVPEVIGIDGVCVGRRKYKRSYCLLTDLSNSKVLELLPKSTQLELARFLNQMPAKKRIKVVVIDMARGFFGVIEKVLPWAVVVIDPFHVVRMLNEAVTKVVRMKQEGLGPAKHKRLMKGGNRFLLLKRRHELTAEEKRQLGKWFKKVPEFKAAYDLKEAGYNLYRITTRDRAEQRFAEWKESIPEELKPAFDEFLGTVGRWEKYIFNYFDHRVSNAFTEGKNRGIKTLQREGPRTSHPVLRARLLYAHVTRNPKKRKSKVKTRDIRKAMKEASAERQAPATWDPNSYVARINNARKESNAFSRLMRPGKGWVERFEHYSYYSKTNSPYKWDFIWPVE